MLFGVQAALAQFLKEALPALILLNTGFPTQWQVPVHHEISLIDLSVVGLKIVEGSIDH